MYVYGGTLKRYVRKLDWSIERVVDEGIHPWSLALFDPNPKLVECNGETLAFKRLSNIVFAYPDGDTIIVGWHDGKRKLCMAGKKVNKPDAGMLFTISAEPEVALGHLVLLGNQFDQHWKEYLRRIFESDVALPIYKHSDESTLRLRNGYLRIFASHIMDARTHAYNLGMELTCDEPEKWQSVPVTLPPELQWPFTMLSAFKPVISGTPLAEMLLGIPQKDIEVRLLCAEAALSKAAEALQASGADEVLVLPVRVERPWTAHCKVGDARYTFRQTDKFPGPSANEHSANLSISKLALSTDGRRLHGSRLALLDLARRQCRTRIPCLAEPTAAIDRNGKLSELADNDIRTLPDVGSRYYILEGCHIDPLIPKFLEDFRKATCDDEDPVTALIRKHRFSTRLPYGVLTGPPGSGKSNFVAILEAADKKPLKVPNLESGKGLSPQYANDILRQLAAESLLAFQEGRRATNCITTRDLRDYLIQRLPIDHGDNPLTQKWVDWLTIGNLENNRIAAASYAMHKAQGAEESSYNAFFDGDMIVYRTSALLGDEHKEKQKLYSRTCRMIRQYVSAIRKWAHPKLSPLQSEVTLMETIESLPLIRDSIESIEDLRNRVLAGTTTFGAIRMNLVKRKITDLEMRKLIVRLCAAVLDYVSYTPEDPEQLVTDKDLLTKLVRNVGFCPHCARNAVEEVIDHPDGLPHDIKMVVSMFKFRMNVEREILAHRQELQNNEFASQLARGKVSAIRRHERGKSSIPKGGKNMSRGFRPGGRHA